MSKKFVRQREQMEEKINSDLGKLLRINRSIQAEGVFAMVKEDMNFRRFLLRGMVKIQVEWTLLQNKSIAQCIGQLLDCCLIVSVVRQLLNCFRWEEADDIRIPSFSKMKVMVWKEPAQFGKRR